VVPNGVFISSPIRNLTVVRDFTFHSFSVTTEADVDLSGCEAEIAAAASLAALALRFAVDLAARV
jgi:hypothetical protein